MAAADIEPLGRKSQANHLDLTLGMFYHGNCSRQDDRYYLNTTYGSFVEAVAGRFSKTLLGEGTLATRHSRADYSLNHPGIEVRQLPYWEHTANYPSVARATRKSLPTIVAELDLAYIRIPLASGWHIWRECRRQQKPVILHVVGNIQEAYSRERSWAGLLAAGLGAYIYERFNQYMINQTPTITQGKQLELKHRRKDNRVLSLPRFNFRRDQIAQRADTCQGQPLKLLWVGRFHTQKGLTHLIEALPLLAAQGLDYQLTLVGDASEEQALNQLKTMVARLKLAPRVFFPGYVSGKEALFTYYDTSDVLVYPSLSEGLPQVVLEAMGRSLPVVSTAVGGLKDILQHGVNCLVVPTNDPQALAGGIARLAGNPDLRRKIIAHGRMTAEGCTIDTFLDSLVELVARWYPGVKAS